MNKLITAGLIIVNILWINVPVLAQNIDETEQCRSAIDNTKSRLTNNLQLEIPF